MREKRTKVLRETMLNSFFCDGSYLYQALTAAKEKQHKIERRTRGKRAASSGGDKGWIDFDTK